MTFRPATKLRARRRLIVSIDGPPMSGKTHFALTAPRPIRVFNVDYGIEGVVDDMIGSGWDMEGVEVEDFALSKAPLTSKGATDAARSLIQQFRASWKETLQRKERTSIVLDTGSEFWQLFRLADLGKLEQVPPMRYTKVNRLFRDLLNEVHHTPHSMILIHRVKDRYDTKVIETDEGQKEVSVRVPGETERDGFKEMDYIVQVSLTSYRKVDGKGRATMGFKVEKCRQRATLVGSRYEGELATFTTLALDVFPQSEPEEWGQ